MSKRFNLREFQQGLLDRLQAQAVQEVAFVEDQLIVPVPPYTIGDWATVIVTVGFDVAANEIFPHSIIMENSIKLSIFCVFIVLTL